MRKRIALFVIGLVLAVGVFLLYQSITGATFLASKKAAPIAASTTQDDRPPTYEQRSPNGDLLYLLSAKKAQQLKDENGQDVPGQYKLEQPVASYYTSDGNLLYIRADKGTITVNDRGTKGKSSMSDVFRGAHLSGNVVLTLGPRDSFTDTSLELKPGQYQVRLEKDLDLNYAEGIVTSPGLIHLRSYDGDVFDGENLTVAFSRTPKDQKIELLRIEPTSGKNNFLLIKNAGRQGQGFSLNGVASGAAATARTGTPATQLAVAPVAPGPATTRASATKVPPTTYKLSFGKDVTATMGNQKLTSDQLYILKMAASEGNGKSKATIATQPVVDATHPAATAPAIPVAAAQDDLTVMWTGPMEMRPAGPDDALLAGPGDLVLDAVGTAERPVQLQDPLHTARAGRLRYHKQNTAVELEMGDVGPVVVTDAEGSDPANMVRKITSGGLSYSRETNHVTLVGPVRIEVPQAALGRVTATGPAVATSAPPLVITTETSLNLDLVAVVDPKDPKRARNPVMRHAVFVGRTHIQDVGFELEADGLDVLLATDAKGNPTLEHLLATGNVREKNENRAGAGISDGAKPDGLIADRLEVMTALQADGKTRQPSRLLATGNVTAWAYDTSGSDNARGAAKRTIYTPSLDAVLMPKVEKPATTMASGVSETTFAKALKTLTATDGVIVEIEDFGGLPVFAKAKTLTVNGEKGRGAATAVLDGERLADGTIAFAEVSKGERGANRVTGLQILLDEKNKSIDVPGKGVFDFLQDGQKAGQPASPVEVSWTKSMHFDNKTNQAHFLGDIDAHLVGKTDQVSTLTAHKVLDVYLTEDAGTGKATMVPATRVAATRVAATMPLTSKLHLSKIFAQGDVEVLGESLDPAGKLLTRLYLQKVDSLTYTEATKTMEIPGAGALLLQDYRPDKIDPKDPNKTDDSNSHGDTAFSWEGNLVYNGTGGTITFSKNVYMKHMPLKPFKMPGVDEAVKTAPAAPAPNDPLILTAQTLVAKLLQSKAAGGGDTIASPLAMGAGGTQKFESVDARGNAVLTLGDSRLGAETLHFDNLTHIATADGTPDNPAEYMRPGEAMAHYDHVSWDLTKGKNAIEATGIHGAFQQN